MTQTPNTGRNLLPTHVKPIHYDIFLEPCLDSFKFSGHSSILLQVLTETKEIVLHSHEIELLEASYSLEDNSNETASSIDYNEKNQTYTLTFTKPLTPKDKPKLYLKFTGILNDQMNGFYRSSYTDPNSNQKKYMASTQFEATEARRAFPCFDEPVLKATFSISIKAKKEFTILSNMDVKEENIENDKKIVKFNQTPIMSTYLVAFAVGEFDYIEGFTKTNIKCRVYTTKGLSEQGRFALEVSTKTLDLFASVFDIDYPLPKLDMLAVPDFDAGAMENWGLVTYRTVLLLFEEKKSAEKTKQRIASVVCHELAHQWFGNIVTMEWWSDLWLNEGFATWVGTYAVDKLFPNWDVWTQFFSDDMARGLQLDQLTNSHPIEVQVNEASEINQIFDAISYSKGASVIRMLSKYLGEDLFLKGIQKYLKNHLYKNAATKDLWNALSEISNKDISKFMEIWTKKIGYPFIEITSHNQNKIHIKQIRYLSSGMPSKDQDSTIWWIPLKYATGNINKVDAEPNIKNEILHNKEAEIEINDLSTDGVFYKFNIDQTGFYRVNYKDSNIIQNLGHLIKQNKVLSSLDKIGLVSDTSALAQSGHSSITKFLDILKYFKNEKNYLVLSEISSTISKILSVWFEQDEQIIKKLKGLVIDTFKHLITEIGWDNKKDKEDPFVPMLRSLVISNLGLSGHKDTIDEAKRRFDLFMDSNNEEIISADIKGAVFSVVLSMGNEDDYNKIMNKYLETSLPDQKMIALSALGTVKNNEKLINKTLEFAISEKVRNQDIIYVMATLGSNPQSRRKSFDFLKQNWSILQKKYKTNLSILGSLLKYTAAQLTTQEDYEDVQNFFKDKDTSPIIRPLKQSLENIENNKNWLKRDMGEVSDWLKKNID